MTEWRQIETAPKNGREILVWDGLWVHTAVFQNGQWFGSAGGVPFFEDDFSDGEYMPGRLYLFPTDWMPLPEPPKRGKLNE